MSGWRRALAVATTFALAAVITPIASAAAPSLPNLDPIDWEAPLVDGGPGGFTNGLFDEDPTGLIPKTPFVQRYSLDQDHWEVWFCGPVSMSMPTVIATLEAASVDYFDALSGGVYEPVFSPGGSVLSDDDGNCRPEFTDGSYPTVGTPEGVLIVDHDYGSGGYASPGVICISNDPDCSWIGTTFPDNYRYIVLGEGALSYDSITVHEIGHTLQWPHSNSGGADQYDNPLDLMSGNLTTGGWTEPDPYATLSYSRFQSGWVATSDVVVADGSYQTVTLHPFNVTGSQMLAIKTTLPGKFYVFGARITSTYDPIPAAWQGVEVYEVDHYCDEPAFGGGICPGIYRDHTQQPPSPDGVGHVLQLGESIVLEGTTVTVTAATATGYTVTVDPGLTEPSAPGTPTVVAGDRQATISWAAADAGGSPIDRYDLEMDELGGDSTVTDVGVVLSTVETDLANGTTYRARVRATNAIGTGQWSDWSADFVPGTVPSPPGVPTVTADDASLSATWTASDDDGGFSITNYRIHLNDQTLDHNSYIDSGPGLTENIGDLVNGHTYQLRVRAENALGAGDWSDWSASVTPATTPTEPLDPSVNVISTTSATAFWSEPADTGGLSITGYELVLENRTVGGTVSRDSGTATTYDLEGLTAGDTYRYRVRAENGEGWGGWSEWSEDFVPASVAGAPGLPSVAADDASLSVSWTPPDDDGGSTITNYELQLSDETADFDSFLDVGAVLSADLDELTNGHTYRVRVRAENANGVGAWSSWSASVTPATTPDAPLEATVTVTSADSATASWSPPADDGGQDITGYELELENRTAGISANHYSGTAPTYEFVALATGETHRYRVRANNGVGDGLWSAWSADFIPGTVPSAPGAPDVAAGDSEIAAAWTAPSSLGSTVDAYEMELENVTVGSAVRVEIGASPEHIFTGVVNDNDYRTRVRAHNATGWGPWSGWSQTVTPQAPPIPPDTFTDDDGSVFEDDIEWLAAAGITRGCNPPMNDRFCPGDSVTRGQMAAFLVRALDLPPGDGVGFLDDDGSVFEADIAALEAAGITRGCNPPMNDRFCPGDSVTRGQMAAFLVRALDLPPGDGEGFADDDGSIFEADIAALASAGITRGCNPPTNDRFCPDQQVTRGQMAAFLHRALTLDG